MTDKRKSMEPRDIIQPSATILGLMLTAVGILVAIAGQDNLNIVKNFSFMFIFVVICFVSASVLTSLAYLLKKGVLWDSAVVFYIIGWIILGSDIVIVLVGYAYGIEALQVLMPSFNQDLVLNILLIVAAFSGLVISFMIYNKLRLQIKRILLVSNKVDVSNDEFLKAKNTLNSSSRDIINSIILLRSEVERELRILGRKYKIKPYHGYRLTFRSLIVTLLEKGAITPSISDSLLLFYRIASAAVHAEPLSGGEIEVARDLGLKLLITLKSKNKENNQREPEKINEDLD